MSLVSQSTSCAVPLQMALLSRLTCITPGPSHITPHYEEFTTGKSYLLNDGDASHTTVLLMICLSVTLLYCDVADSRLLCSNSLMACQTPDGVLSGGTLDRLLHHHTQDTSLSAVAPDVWSSTLPAHGLFCRNM